MERQIRYFELVGNQHGAGAHNAPHPEGKKGADGRVMEVKYVQGDVIPFDGDLCAKFANKFREVSGPRRVGDGFASAPGGVLGAPSDRPPVPSVSPAAALEAMDEKTLRDFAAAEEIDIKGAKTKADVLAKVKAAVATLATV